jgi:hypothetical protein
MTTWIAGTEESTIAAVEGALPGRGGLPGRGSSAPPPPREPAGTWHAIDPDTGDAACGTNRFLEPFANHRWNEPGDIDRCAACLAVVPLA